MRQAAETWLPLEEQILEGDARGFDSNPLQASNPFIPTKLALKHPPQRALARGEIPIRPEDWFAEHQSQ